MDQPPFTPKTYLTKTMKKPNYILGFAYINPF